MQPLRTYIAALNPSQFEEILTHCPAVALQGSTSDGQAAISEIYALCPDVLIVEDTLPGMDGYALISRLQDARLLTPPRVLMCAWQTPPALYQSLLDIAVPMPLDPAGLIRALEGIAAVLTPRLALASFPKRLELAAALLTELDMPQNLKGRAYIEYAAAYASCSPLLEGAYHTLLYPALAKQFAASAWSVERAMRTAIENTWLSGTLPAMHRLFGMTIDAERGKPTNTEFIAMLAQHIKNGLT